MKNLSNKIAKLAKKYGYTEILPKDFQEYVGKDEKGIKVLRVFANLEDPYKNTWVQIYEEEDSGQKAVSYYYWSGPSGAWDPLEQWADEEIWKQMTEEWD